MTKIVAITILEFTLRFFIKHQFNNNIIKIEFMNLRRTLMVSLTIALLITTFFTTGCTSTADQPSEITATTGLAVTASTSTAGGNYSPRNIVAVWVENSSGQFVKSLAVYAAKEKSYLTHWKSSSTSNTTDAATGATRSSYSAISVTWDGTDTSDTEVADGTYIVCMELTDKNGTGNYSTFNFTKGTAEETLTPDDEPSFSNITIKWMPL